MYEAIKDIACFVTAFVGFTYGIRVAWGCGKRGPSCENTHDKWHLLLESIPSAALLLTVGFLVIYSSLLEDFFSWVLVSVTSAIVLSLLTVLAAMPQFKKAFRQDGLVVELQDGSVCQMNKKVFNACLSNGKVIRFKRAEGWVDVEQACLRNIVAETVYVGVERRENV